MTPSRKNSSQSSYAQQFTGGRRFDPAAGPRSSDARVMPALELSDDD